MCASRLRRSDRRRAAAHACRLSRSCPRTTTARHRARGCPHASRGAFDGRRRPIGAPRRRTSRPSRPVRRALRLAGRAVLTARARIERARIRVARCALVAAGRAIAGAAGRAFVGAPRRLRVGAARARRGRRAGRTGRTGRGGALGRRTLAARAAGVVRGARLRDALAFGCRGRARRPRRALRRSVRRAARRRRLGSRCGLRSRLRRGGFRARRFRVGPRDLARGEAAGADGARPGVAGRGFLTVNFVRINAGILTLRSRAAARFRLGSADGCRTSRCRRA